MSLSVSFCTNSVALPLAYKVNGGNKFIIVFWCLYLSLRPYIQAITKIPLHVKKIPVLHIKLVVKQKFMTEGVFVMFYPINIHFKLSSCNEVEN